MDSTTVKNYLRSVEAFAEFPSHDDPREVSRDDILQWRIRLGKTSLVIGTQNAKIRQVKYFYKRLHQSGRALSDPGEKLSVLRKPRTLPRNVLSAAQVIKLLRVPGTNTPGGIRYRAMLEMLYSSGLRSGELCKLTVYDLDAEARTLRIIQAKGRNDRIVPVGLTSASCEK